MANARGRRLLTGGSKGTVPMRLLQLLQFRHFWRPRAVTTQCENTGNHKLPGEDRHVTSKLRTHRNLFATASALTLALLPSRVAAQEAAMEMARSDEAGQLPAVSGRG